MYAIPCDVSVSCSWQCHCDRNPPSSEPGTDYASGYGTPVAAAGGGWITDLKTSPSGAMGRYVQISLDDGRTVRYLHLSEIWVGWDSRVERGQIIAVSGASGYGDDWYYGPHVHTTLWLSSPWSAPTVDFQLYAGEDPPPPPEPPKGKGSEMFIAIIGTVWYLVIDQGSQKPRAVALDGNSGMHGSAANEAVVPRFTFTEEWAIQNLRAAVDGLP